MGRLCVGRRFVGLRLHLVALNEICWRTDNHLIARLHPTRNKSIRQLALVPGGP